MWRLTICSYNSQLLEMDSVQFSHSVVSDSLRPHKLQHTRPPCPSTTPRVHSDSSPSSRWYYPAISVVPFSSCPQSLPASESLPMSQLFTWGGQSTGVLALASFLPKNTQDRSPLELSVHIYMSISCGFSFKAYTNFNHRKWFMFIILYTDNYPYLVVNYLKNSILF